MMIEVLYAQYLLLSRNICEFCVCEHGSCFQKKLQYLSPPGVSLLGGEVRKTCHVYCYHKY